jgi:hypothetical protein
LQKVILISAVYILLAGCSVLRKEKSEISGISNDLTEKNLIKILTKGNLSDSSFYIQKAEVEIITNGEKEKFLAAWKYEKSGRSLLSFRSRTGIEVVRILITKDTVLVNDRINRKTYYGKGDYIAGKYDLNVSSLPVFIGDFIGGNYYLNEFVKCNEGSINLQTSIKGLKTDYIIDCKKNKIISTSMYNSLNEKEIDINFSKFIKVEQKIIASRILVKYYKNNYEVNIKIDKIICPWDGKVEFIPGKKYEVLELQ